jgi:hypothetical protein
MKKLFLLVVVLITIIGCNQNEKKSSHSYNTINTIKLHQELPDITHMSLGNKEETSHGDLTAFDAIFTNNKDLNGKLSGFIMTVDVPSGTESFQDRIVQMAFDFGDSNTIVIGGKTVYPNSLGAEFTKLIPQTRAVIGGTGTYMGARGQLTSTRNDDGTYEHLIELMD